MALCPVLAVRTDYKIVQGMVSSVYSPVIILTLLVSNVKVLHEKMNSSICQVNVFFPSMCIFCHFNIFVIKL